MHVPAASLDKTALWKILKPSWHLNMATTHPGKYALGAGALALAGAFPLSLLRNGVHTGNQLYNGMRDVDEVVPPINKFGMDKSASPSPFKPDLLSRAGKFMWNHKYPIMGVGAGLGLGVGYLAYKGADKALHGAGNFAGNAAYDLTHVGDGKTRGAGAFDDTQAYRALQDEMMKHTRMSQMQSNPGMKYGLAKFAGTGGVAPWNPITGNLGPSLTGKSISSASPSQINWQDNPAFSRNEMIKGINNKYTGAIGGALGGSVLSKQMGLGSAGELLMMGLGGVMGYSQFPNMYNRMTNFPGLGSNSSAFSRSMGHNTAPFTAL